MSPLYEYHCQACGEDFDKLQLIEGRDLVSCPTCGARADRLISPFQFRMFNKFTKDGPGFQSVRMSNDEYNKRIKERSLEEALRSQGKTPVYYNKATGGIELGKMEGKHIF